MIQIQSDSAHAAEDIVSEHAEYDFEKLDHEDEHDSAPPFPVLRERMRDAKQRALSIGIIAAQLEVAKFVRDKDFPLTAGAWPPTAKTGNGVANEPHLARKVTNQAGNSTVTPCHFEGYVELRRRIPSCRGCARV